MFSCFIPEPCPPPPLSVKDRKPPLLTDLHRSIGAVKFRGTTLLCTHCAASLRLPVNVRPRLRLIRQNNRCALQPKSSWASIRHLIRTGSQLHRLSAANCHLSFSQSLLFPFLCICLKQCIQYINEKAVCQRFFVNFPVYKLQFAIYIENKTRFRQNFRSAE